MLNINNTRIKGMKLIEYAINSLGDKLSDLEFGQGIVTYKPAPATKFQRISDTPPVWSRSLLCLNQAISKHNTAIYKIPCQHLAKHFFCSSICAGEGWLNTASGQTVLKAFILNFIGSQMLCKSHSVTEICPLFIYRTFIKVNRRTGTRSIIYCKNFKT